MCFHVEQIYQQIKAKRNPEKRHESRHFSFGSVRLCNSLAATQNEVQRNADLSCDREAIKLE